MVLELLPNSVNTTPPISNFNPSRDHFARLPLLPLVVYCRLAASLYRVVELASGTIILSLDTHSRTTSLAVLRSERILSSYQGEPHEERLLIEIESLLHSVSLTARDVDMFAFCCGPGIFTSLAVEISAVKELAAAAQKPAQMVTSLEVSAFAAGPAPAVFSMISSDEEDLYCQLFSFDDDGAPVAESPPTVARLEQALAQVVTLNPLTFAGSGAVANEASIRMAGPWGKGWSVAQSDLCFAEEVGRLVFLQFSRGEIDLDFW